MASEKKILLREIELKGFKSVLKGKYDEIFERNEGFTMEEALIRRMIRKVRQVMQFYIETRNLPEFEAFKAEYMRLKTIKSQMGGYGKALKGNIIRDFAKENGFILNIKKKLSL